MFLSDLFRITVVLTFRDQQRTRQDSPLLAKDEDGIINCSSWQSLVESWEYKLNFDLRDLILRLSLNVNILERRNDLLYF